jgi:hypothetical protein
MTNLAATSSCAELFGVTLTVVSYASTTREENQLFGLRLLDPHDIDATWAAGDD